MKQTYIRMNDGLHKKLRHEAAENDISMNRCIVTLLQEALEARRADSPTPLHTDLRPQEEM